jgi:hypothetical protein
VSQFTLTINGGSHGILVTTKSMCKAKQVGGVDEIGQNGGTHSGQPQLSTTCRK